jgi:hypothetical protein
MVDLSDYARDEDKGFLSLEESYTDEVLYAEWVPAPASHPIPPALDLALTVY